MRISFESWLLRFSLDFGPKNEPLVEEPEDEELEDERPADYLQMIGGSYDTSGQKAVGEDAPVYEWFDDEDRVKQTRRRPYSIGFAPPKKGQ